MYRGTGAARVRNPNLAEPASRRGRPLPILRGRRIHAAPVPAAGLRSAPAGHGVDAPQPVAELMTHRQYHVQHCERGARRHDGVHHRLHARGIAPHEDACLPQRQCRVAGHRPRSSECMSPERQPWRQYTNSSFKRTQPSSHPTCALFPGTPNPCSSRIREGRMTPER